LDLVFPELRGEDRKQLSYTGAWSRARAQAPIVLHSSRP
jgi:hypothetical protein